MILKILAAFFQFFGPLGKPLADWFEDRRKKKFAKMWGELEDLRLERNKILERIRDAKGEVLETLFEDFTDISDRIAYLKRVLLEKS